MERNRAPPMTTAVRSPDTASAHYFVFELQSAAEELKRQGSDKVDSSSSMCLPFFPMSFQTPQNGHACTELLDKKTNKIRKVTTVLIDNAYCLSDGEKVEKRSCGVVDCVLQFFMFINDFPKTVAGAKGDCVPRFVS
ncbi:hypothetical protein DY000_02018079 [Brassica cretica]|uniref:Uncharacterized protein n=1 Tax=Brassica cretica TaxID=69181 RepID=A0ABQ7D517_BRACR|nr:hypothetical protein DY000_02018079 [Brassica cretica]